MPPFRQDASELRVIVVDDGSTDGTREGVAAQFPEVTVLQGDGSLWWAGAMNVGVRAALSRGAEYVLALNDDVEVFPDHLENMLAWAERKPEALFGSYAFDIRTRQPYYGGGRIDWRRGRTIQLLDTCPEPERRGLVEVTHLPGRGMWIPSRVFETIGLFDAGHLPHYLSDYDFSCRAARHGYELFANYDARLLSHVDLTQDCAERPRYSLSHFLYRLRGRKSGANLRDFTIFAWRHCPPEYLLRYWSYGVAARIGGYLRDWALSL